MPLTFTEPLVIGTNPLIARRKVDLPAPDIPTITTSSPSGMVTLRALSALNPLG
jgi:hypothetical protein